MDVFKKCSLVWIQLIGQSWIHFQGGLSVTVSSYVLSIYIQTSDIIMICHLNVMDGFLTIPKDSNCWLIESAYLSINKQFWDREKIGGVETASQTRRRKNSRRHFTTSKAAM